MMLEGSTIVPFHLKDQTKSKHRSVFLVKLTDACRSNLDQLLKTVSFKSSNLPEVGNVDIRDNDGSSSIQLGLTNPTEYRFVISDMQNELAKGQLQSISQSKDADPIELCGEITQRLKILANDKETFESAKKKALQEIEDAKRQSEILMNVKTKNQTSKSSPSGLAHRKLQNLGVPSQNQRPITPVKGLSKPSSQGSGSKPASQSGAASSSMYGDVAKKSLRQRIIQHLALQSTKPVALLARLAKEGLSDEDKALFETYLNDVAQPKAQSNGEMELRPNVWSDVRTDWPHYITKYDKECVKKFVAAKIRDKSLHSTSQQQQHASDSLMFSKKDDSGKSRVVPPPPVSSSGVQQAVSMSPGYASPLDAIIPDPELGRRRSAKRSAISTTTAANDAYLSPAKQSAHEAGRHVYNLDSVDAEDGKKPGGSIAKSSNGLFVSGPTINGQNTVTTANSHQSVSLFNLHINNNTSNGNSTEDGSSPPDHVFNNNNNEIKNSHAKHRSTAGGDIKKTSKNSAESVADERNKEKNEQIDYLKLFPQIRNIEERRQYKEMFDRDYQKYMNAYNKLRTVALEFEKLGERLDKLEDRNSRDYKSIEREIYRKYEKFEKDPELVSCKKEHENLRSKLSVLKQRCMEYDKV